MTFVTIYRDADARCLGFDVVGHAGYAEAGEDIVCAGLSILVINTCNSLERFTDTPCSVISDEEEGSISLRLQDAPTEQTDLLLSAMILGIEDLAANYGQYIQLSYEEV